MTKLIKLFTALILSFITISMLCVNIFAEDSTQNPTNSVDAKVAEIINSQLSDEEISILKSMEGGYNFEYPVLKINNSSSKSRYLALDTTPFIITIYEENSEAKVHVNKNWVSNNLPSYITEGLPTYISDIINMSEVIIIGDKECKLEGIQCDDGEASHDGTNVYLQTDQGVYVKHYEYYFSEAVVFTEAEFESDYSEYISYCQATVLDEDGNILRGHMTFIQYLEARDNNTLKYNTPKKDNTIYYVIGVTACVAVTAVVFVWVKKRKKQKTEN